MQKTRGLFVNTGNTMHQFHWLASARRRSYCTTCYLAFFFACSDAELYVKIMQKIVEKGNDYPSSEASRIERLLGMFPWRLATMCCWQYGELTSGFVFVPFLTFLSTTVSLILQLVATSRPRRSTTLSSAATSSSNSKRIQPLPFHSYLKLYWLLSLVWLCLTQVFLHDSFVPSLSRRHTYCWWSCGNECNVMRTQRD